VGVNEWFSREGDRLVLRTDRSRIEEFQRCHLRRWLGSYHQGRGVRLKRRNLHLLVGGATHDGIANLIDMKDVERAVEVGVEAFRYEAEGHQLDVTIDEDQYEVAQEQMALVEGLIRTFHHVVGPQLEGHQVVGIEEEETASLGTFNPGINSYMEVEIQLMGRADWITRTPDGELMVWSLKTPGRWDQRKDKAAMTDIQGLSEAWLVEGRLGEKVMGVQMVHLLKGTRRPDKGGKWVTWSPLIRGWRKMGLVGMEYAHSYSMTGPDGKETRLGKGWERFEAWKDPMGVKGWIEMLGRGEVQPGAPDPLEGSVVMPFPYMRNEEDSARWLEQTRGQEIRVARSLLQSNGGGPVGELGEQYRHSCHYPSDCQFLNYCTGSDSYRANLLATGDYEIREYNHPQEAPHGD